MPCLENAPYPIVERVRVGRQKDPHVQKPLRFEVRQEPRCELFCLGLGAEQSAYLHAFLVLHGNQVV